jgi:beta-N-acetylhexosaminidase
LFDCSVLGKARCDNRHATQRCTSLSVLLFKKASLLPALKPAIIGIAGVVPTPEEIDCLEAHQPAGAILFARNVRDPAQLESLTGALRALLPPGAVLMVDQEGGRVARLRPPHWRAHPSAGAIGRLGDRAERVAWLTGALIGLDCRQAGFDVVAAPVLDVASPEAHDVIGDRSFGSDPEAVARLGRAFAQGLLAAGVQPVGKHAPGHGRALADSHVELPVLDDITPADLIPFSRNTDLPWLMTAHVRYTSLDMDHPATQSATIVRSVIRATGFDGILVSDDLAMQALRGSPAERALAALAAGCDVALHCSGIIEDTRSVLEALDHAQAPVIERLGRGRRLAADARQALHGATLAEERDALMARA